MTSGDCVHHERPCRNASYQLQVTEFLELDTIIIRLSENILEGCMPIALL